MDLFNSFDVSQETTGVDLSGHVVPAAKVTAPAETKAKGDGNPIVASPLNLHTDSSTQYALEAFRHNDAWVYSSVRTIAQRIAGQKIIVARKQRQGPGKRSKAVDGKVKLKLLPEHPLHQAFDDPNPVSVSWALKFVIIAGLELTGKYYLWLREGGDRPLEIWPLPPSWVYPEHSERRLYDRYLVRPHNYASEFWLDHDEVLMLAYPDPASPYLGAISPLQSQARAVLADESLQTAQHKAFQNGLNPGLALIVGRHPDTAPGQPGSRPILTADQRKQLIVALKQAYAGAMKWDEPLILDGLIEDAKRITQSVREMDFLQSGVQTKERIVQGFGLNPIVFGQVEGVNRASATVADENFCQNCINPKIELINATMTRFFRGWYSDPDLVVEIEPARSNDPDAKRADLDQLGRFGAVTKNELRRAHGLEDLKVGGDELVEPNSGGLGAASPAGFRLTLADRQG